MQTKREQVQKFLEQTIEKYGLQNIKNMQFQLGIDEAGRGPVFGTMVYSALWWPIQFKQKFAQLGFQDSKQLTEDKRQFLFQLINILKDKIVFYEIRQLSATQISTNMNNLKYNINLNQLSHNAALQLSKRAFQQGFKVTHLYADTVGDPEKYRIFLTNNLEKHQQIFKKITVQSKADDKYKVVSASSICAKVTRDSILKNWKFIQKIDFKGALGSGYPGDPKTKQWLVQNKHSIFGYPNIVRFSWATASNNLKGALKMKVNEQQNEEIKFKKLNYMQKNKVQMQKDLWQVIR